jgi:hypothetical protein
MILVLLTVKSFGQRILKQYDFNKGGYYVCLLEGPIGKDRAIPTCPVRDEYAIDTTSFFYTSDTVVLNSLKKELVLYQQPAKNGISTMYLCGYPFLFCVYKERKLLLKLPANLECGYMSTSMGQMLFNSKTLKRYKKVFKPLTLKYTCFDSVDERTKFLELIQKDSSYVSCKVLGGESGSNTLPVQTIQLK